MLRKSAARHIRRTLGSSHLNRFEPRMAFQPLEPRKLLFGDPVFDIGTLDGTNGFRIPGAASGQLGFSITALGDINGDGIDDLAVSAPSEGGMFQDGTIYVVFGKAGLGTGGQFDLATLNGANGFVITGIETAGIAGWSISWAGDVNNDNFDDLIIGAPGANKAYILYGAAGVGGTGAFSLGDINGINGVEILGGPDDVLGLTVAGIGDLNKDGYDDVALGSSQNLDNAGATYVVFGGSSIGISGAVDVLNLNGSNGLRIYGINPGDNLGWKVSTGGDVNDDGIDDLLIGSIENDVGGPGAAYVVFGAMGIGMSTGGVIDLTTLNGANGFVIDGPSAGLFFGFSVSGGDDINGDGVDDLLIGSVNQKAYVIFGSAGVGAGGAFDINLLNGNNGYVVSIPVGAGTYAVHAGDLNDDGIGDVAIAAFGRDEVYVYIGGPSVGSGGVFDATTVDGDNGFIIQGVSLLNGIIGNPVSTGKDVNDDGKVDLLIGAASANMGDGEAYVLFGVSITNLSAPTNLVATALDEMSIELQWQDTTVFEDGFEVERSLDGVTGWTLVTTTPPSTGMGGVVVYPDGSLAPDTQYFYRVRAYNMVTNSAYSNVASATTQGTPVEPSNLQVATVSNTALRLTWNDNSTNETGFNIYRYNGSMFVFLDSVGADTTSYDDIGLNPATMYTYLVRAVNGTGESPDSNVAVGTTSGGMISAPAAPSGLTAIAISATEIQLNWIDNSNNEDGFYIERATSPNGAWSQIDLVLPDQTQYVNMGLPADSTYFYRIRAYNATGTSTPSNVAGATTSPTQGGTHSAQFADLDGDMVTFTLIGIAGNITYTTSLDGTIDTLYVGTQQMGVGSLIMTITQGASGDGRVEVGQLQGDIASGDLYVRVASVNLGLVDIVGGGAWFCDVNRVVLGDIIGAASIQGRVADLTVGDVDTTGNISLCDVYNFKARSLNLGGGFDAHSVANFNVDGPANFRLSLDGDQGLGSMRIGGNASLQLQVHRAGKMNIVGNAQFIGSSYVDNSLSCLKIGGSWLGGSLTVDHLMRKIEIVGNAAGSATLNASGGCVVVSGNSAATFNLNHFAKFIVKGNLTGGAVVLTDASAGMVCIKGDFSSGAIDVDAAGLWCVKIDGSLAASASLDSAGDLHKVMIRGSLSGSIDTMSAYCVIVCGDFDGTFNANGSSGEVVHKFCVKGAADGAVFAAVGDVNCIMFGELLQAEVYVGLPINWGGGLPSTLGDFVQQSVLRKFQVGGLTNGATIASANIANLCLKEISNSNTFHLAAGQVDHAKMIVQNQPYNLGLNKIFTDLPMLGYLDILQLF